MKRHGKIFRMAVLPASLLAVFGTALAEDDEVGQFINPDSTISVGAGIWSGDRHQQGVFDGMRDDKAYGLLDAEVSKRNDATGTWYMLNAKGLGLDNRELRVDLFRQGDIGGFLEYSRTPRDNPYTIVTPLQGIGTSTVTVGTHVGTFTAREVEIGTTRELLRLGGFKKLLPGLDLKIDFKNEDKKGTRQMGWGSAALFSVEPINSTTRQLEVALQYTGEKLQLSGGYYGSWYDNKYNQLLEVLNGITGGTSAGFNSVTPISLPLDNQAHQVFVDGGYSFTPTTRGTFKVAYTHATQNEHLPSIDLGGANAPFINSPSNLNGKVDTTLLQFGFTSKPIPKLTINANLRYYDVDDKTPLAGYVGNNGTGVATVFNTPLSYTTTSGKLEGIYSLPMNFKVTGGVDYSEQDRGYPTVGTQYVPYRSTLKETTYRIQLRRLLAEDVNGSLAYLRSERDGSGFTPATYDNAVNPQINPIHIADRNRDKIRAGVDWDPTENRFPAVPGGFFERQVPGQWTALWG